MKTETTEWLNQTVLDDNGAAISVKSLLTGKKNVLFVFYPGDFTPVCTAQLCSYRDRMPDLSKFPVEIIGISHDPANKHAEFKKAYNLPFKLYSDPKHAFAKSIGATSKLLLGAATRANILVNHEGKILMKHTDALPITHQRANTLLEDLTQLQSDGVI